MRQKKIADAIQKCLYFQIPIKIWLTIFDSVLQPIALYRSELRDPLSHQSNTCQDKHQTESLHAEFCIFILYIHRNTPTQAYRAKLRKYPLIINIEKRASKIFNHLKASSQDTLHYKALQTQELNPEECHVSASAETSLSFSDTLRPVSH